MASRGLDSIEDARRRFRSLCPNLAIAMIVDDPLRPHGEQCSGRVLIEQDDVGQNVDRHPVAVDRGQARVASAWPPVRVGSPTGPELLLHRGDGFGDPESVFRDVPPGEPLALGRQASR